MDAPSPITKLLVANRGEIARRVMRSARARAVATVAVFSDADRGSPFVAEADESVRLPGTRPADTYLNIGALVEAARLAGADAVHPGYGFLSESADFAAACGEAGLCFVGPSPEVIAAMGSKVRAKALMAAAGVPVLPGAVVEDAADVLEAAEALGWPLLIKAAYGGGGRGMRVVASAAEVPEAVAAARGEAASAFGDATVFVERYLTSPRHVEVQIFGDHHGTVIHLFERECSIQRRHQKIVEEAPSPAVGAGLRDALCSAAVTAARAIGYVGAGTVEFVLDDGGRFYFLEVNTRLQVEHPVTEAVTGLDLVALQLSVAAGEPLPPEAVGARLCGHAVEARLYAEDVEAGFLPVSGTVERFRVGGGPGVRVDGGVEDGSVVSTHYDALLAKVVAAAPTRDIAARRLADALARAELHGLTTNRDLLVRVVRHPEFLAGRTDTGFLSRHDPAVLGRPLADETARRLHAAGAALAEARRRRRAVVVQPGVPAGWRNVGDRWQHTVVEDRAGPLSVSYRLDGPSALLRVDGAQFSGPPDPPAEAPGAPGPPVGPPPGGVPGPRWRDAVDLESGGLVRRVEVSRYGPTLWVDSVLGGSSFHLVDRLPEPGARAAPGSLRAPMPGSVARILVAPGDVVGAGAVLLVLEAMKMEHPVRSPNPGTVREVTVATGDQVDTGAVLALVEEDCEPA